MTMNHNLTDKQLEALRWLVGQVKDGAIGESFTVQDASTAAGVKILVDFKKLPESLGLGTLDALSASDVLVSNPYEKRYTLTRKAYEIATFDFSNPEPDPIRSCVKETHRLMLKSFGRDDLRQVCFELNVDPEWVFGDEKDWPFQLLLYLYRQNRLGELAPILQEQRPSVEWPPFPTYENDASQRLTHE